MSLAAHTALDATPQRVMYYTSGGGNEKRLWQKGHVCIWGRFAPEHAGWAGL